MLLKRFNCIEVSWMLRLGWCCLIHNDSVIFRLYGLFWRKLANILKSASETAIWLALCVCLVTFDLSSLSSFFLMRDSRWLPVSPIYVALHVVSTYQTIYTTRCYVHGFSLLAFDVEIVSQFWASKCYFWY